MIDFFSCKHLSLFLPLLLFLIPQQTVSHSESVVADPGENCVVFGDHVWCEEAKKATGNESVVSKESQWEQHFNLRTSEMDNAWRIH